MTDTPIQYTCTTPPGVLHTALLDYEATGDKEALREVFNNYKNPRRIKLISPPQRGLIPRVLSSFTIFPSGEYEHDLLPYTPKTSTEAIASCWQTVGEYLSFAMIQHTLNNGDGKE